jgi:hypothetical protein
MTETVPAASIAVQGALRVVESEDACFVVLDSDPADWLVRFQRSDGFPADRWAGGMVDAHNARRSR